MQVDLRSIWRFAVLPHFTVYSELLSDELIHLISLGCMKLRIGRSTNNDGGVNVTPLTE